MTLFLGILPYHTTCVTFANEVNMNDGSLRNGACLNKINAAQGENLKNGTIHCNTNQEYEQQNANRFMDMFL